MIKVQSLLRSYLHYSEIKFHLVSFFLLWRGSFSINFFNAYIRITEKGGKTKKKTSVHQN